MLDVNEPGNNQRQVNFEISNPDHAFLQYVLIKIKANQRDYFMGLHHAALQRPDFLDWAPEASRRWKTPQKGKRNGQMVMKLHVSKAQRQFLARSLVTYGFGLIAVASVEAAKIPFWAAITCVLSGLCLQATALVLIRD